ncbi:hypothetical protein GRO01_10240 [Gluconobacter roseus NBRC 3990]|uniref:Uncharacterized protein n=1 Tax=Gluconobacter roseus NBRC 3990 TaxID=1307950 RepID=A0A4Y3M7I4_9PROT|nr:hypothetical protein AA3990_1969 [Gluconobacter roseus NBRC 3990]GEB03448.1 hypothetical protein GRO01_10240 [Gluconobacter roseus NBRC 3990]
MLLPDARDEATTAYLLPFTEQIGCLGRERKARYRPWGVRGTHIIELLLTIKV